MPGRNEVMAVRGGLDRVDVEVVVRLVGAGRDAGVALVEGDVVQGLPVVQDGAGGDVDLLEYPVQHRAARRPTAVGEVAGNLEVADDQGGVDAGQIELVLVRADPVVGADGGDDVVLEVGDHVPAGGVGGEPGGRRLPPGDDRLSAVGLQATVGVRLLPGGGPQRGTGRVGDQRPRIGGAHVGEEQIAAGDQVAAGDHVERRTPGCGRPGRGGLIAVAARRTVPPAA